MKKVKKSAREKSKKNRPKKKGKKSAKEKKKKNRTQE
jgi:hypothetical protein